MNTPDRLGTVKKAEELLNNHNELDLDHYTKVWLIEEIINNIQKGLEKAHKAEDLLRDYKEELKGKKIGGEDAKRWLIKKILDKGEIQEDEPVSFVAYVPQNGPNRGGCTIF